MNNSQAEKKVYAFHEVFRVDVNDVKPIQNPTETSPIDHFLDLKSMPRLFKTINRRLIQTLLLLTLFQQSSYYGGSGWLRAYQNDYVIDNYVEPAVILRTHTSPMDKYHLQLKLASYCIRTMTQSVCCVSLFRKYSL